MALTLATLSSACTAENVDYRAPVDEAPIAADSPSALAVLRLINHPSTTYSVLDARVGLDRRAAMRIIARRDGMDGLAGTADDQPFLDLASLDAVKYVGDAALNRLAEYAHAHGWVVDDAAAYGVVMGIQFSMGEARRALDLANRADADTLEYMIGLAPDVVEALVEVRPFASLQEVILLSEVDQAALKALRGW
ncbi:MAG: hypothetical protein KC613_01020 [Myxococcales bacterium]|nr:hypothetical protein [Myxococcales bacterium]MCB9525991.1 hypothetical protein [Myxococcales bacterium]